MNENPNHLNESPEETASIVNDYGATKDSAVVIEEETRTVLLTNDETIVIEKSPTIDIVPRNRPRKVYAGMWGTAEITTVGLGMLAILAAILLYIFVVMPAKSELGANKKKRDALETELLSARNKYGDITNTETQVGKLLTSVGDFETRFLRNPLLDKTSLYQRLNGLIAAYNLTNTTGPDYAPLEIVETKPGGQQSEAERGRSKFQSLFPGVYVTTTLEGSYQNLRRFIREVETSEQFVTITAIEFQPAETEQKIDPTKPPKQVQQINQVKINPSNPNGVPQNPTFTTVVPETTETRAARGKTRGETVSLRLEMAAYFRRPTAQTIISGNPQPPSK
ncbi:MAG: hypothetical protein M3T96_08965 [Acidobacteriota bacterium]|nr:hypothetical protein [Acidobacteriota bacterium]